jgi:hypothetical protein
MKRMESFVGGSLAAGKANNTGQVPIRCHTNEDTKPSEASQKIKKNILLTVGWVELLFLTNMIKSTKVRWAGHVA